MTHFEAYHWEDHVPRAGGWKLNLAAGLLALGLIYAALPDAFGNAPAATASTPAAIVHDPVVEVQYPLLDARPVEGAWAHCPTAMTDLAES